MSFSFLQKLNGGEEILRNWAFIPQRFSANPIGDLPTNIHFYVYACGMELHLSSNMLFYGYLVINVEDQLGKTKYLFSIF